MDRGNEGQPSHDTKQPSSGTPWEGGLEAEGKSTTSNGGGHLVRGKRSRNTILMRRPRVLSPVGGSNRRRGRVGGIKSRVRTLKKLVPNTESMELDLLFRETADYIMSLEMRVRVMQTMVQLLTGSN